MNKAQRKVGSGEIGSQSHSSLKLPKGTGEIVFLHEGLTQQNIRKGLIRRILNVLLKNLDGLKIGFALEEFLAERFPGVLPCRVGGNTLAQGFDDPRIF